MRVDIRQEYLVHLKARCKALSCIKGCLDWGDLSADNDHVFARTNGSGNEQFHIRSLEHTVLYQISSCNAGEFQNSDG